MKILLSATALFVFASLSLIPSQRLLAQEALPVAGPAIASNNNDDQLPSAGPAIVARASGERQSSSRASRRSKVISRAEPRRVSRRSIADNTEAPRRISRRSTAVNRTESKPRVRTVNYTTQGQTPTRRRIRKTTAPTPKIQAVPGNFPIRRW
ncbi:MULTISPECIES: hypothetical protein [Calothrix]|uniref:Uncharacterized protein n=2 Tax=Calothrix TaxID=1186 RepID=A0ABR8AC34_9CYAN|nr:MULTISPECIES: hypothetical protein [Calothrix]MBD2197506.1 hypothetical protein [Calothrix parietina FACHB-288]MBD2226120.1 hypothetical protein [Calothrix anomala FACHB-343]